MGNCVRVLVVSVKKLACGDPSHQAAGKID